MSNKYRVILQHIADSGEGSRQGRTLQFDIVSHDDIIDIADIVRTKAIVPDDEASVLAVGMKLLGQVVLKHRKELAFADFWPHFESFLRSVKRSV
ncbi:DUF3861 family protein [Rhizobium gallicum]|uniref:DUF3861 family protein n=1 Tax=Rhizobium gallicum TaxID=56730 RepID=UPI001EF7D7B6|nr:DUF3861 family protein [Rhizobium gallicum]ULJ76544.1 DUF3861 domain-containing protein [Rhizobium gallicum]